MIVKLKPALKDYIWGGTKLKTEYGKASENNVAESWELSCNPDGASVIDSGTHSGKLLSEVITRADWGCNCRDFPFFPVLNKLIDAKSNLSVQVHPDDEYALKYENQFGKTECWHILDAEPNAVIYMGLSRSMTKEEFSQAIRNKSILGYLNAVPVKKGETYFIASGTLHAIGAGVTLFEIQQNSALTYRVYDYDRKDANGVPRQLHIDKAMQVANLEKIELPVQSNQNLLCKCKYFSAYRYVGEKEFLFADSFCSITTAEGAIDVNGLPMKKGNTCFASAGERIKVCGNGEYILTCVEK